MRFLATYNPLALPAGHTRPRQQAEESAGERVRTKHGCSESPLLLPTSARRRSAISKISNTRTSVEENRWQVIKV